jgi:mannose/fructose/sorbose-specific phosphotransferase system IIA component
MIGVTIATHGSLSESLKESVKMIIGEMEQFNTVTLDREECLDDMTGKLQDAADEVDSGEGVICLLDLFGGTPSNAALLISQERPNFYAVSGVNFPMIAELFVTRPYEKDIQKLVDLCVESGKNGIVDLVKKFNNL